MKDRILIGDLEKHIDNYVNIAGWVDSLRDLKKMQFLILRDHTGLVQAVNFKSGKDLDSLVSSLSKDVVIIAGGNLVKSNSKLHGYEIQLDKMNIVNRPIGHLPVSEDSSLDTRLDWRYVDLRDPNKLLIFQIQTTAEHAMREFWNDNRFIEIHSPKLIEGASESGAELFTLNYFGLKASLAQSPQFYKQMAMAAGFDRVFEIGPVFRANSSHTSRHDTEFTSIDMEISWIDSHEDVMEIESNWLSYVITKIVEKHGSEIKKVFGFDLEVPILPFPKVTMEQAHNILKDTGYIVPRELKGDLDPEGEKRLSQFIKNTLCHDFVFVTEYPISARPFYHMRFEDRPNVTKSFDLLWNGIEMTTGAQREHRYDFLVKQAQEKGIDIPSISYYFDFFKNGCPPHGGLGFGLSRMLMNLTGHKNVKEVTYLYRGPNRLRP